MLALANILNKSFLAFVYIGEATNESLCHRRRRAMLLTGRTDLGLSLAQSLDDPALSTPQHQQRPDFLEAKRVRVTLLTLRGYAQEYSQSSDSSRQQNQNVWVP